MTSIVKGIPSQKELTITRVPAGSVNYTVLEPKIYISIQNTFYVYRNDLRRIIHSDIYSDFRKHVDSIIDGTGFNVEKGFTQMDSYITVGKNIHEFLIKNKLESPYVSVFRYLLMYYFEITSIDVPFDREELMSLLKLDELVKLIKFKLPTLPIKGGNPDQQIQPRRVVRRNWCLTLTGIAFAASSLILSGFSLGGIGDTVSNTIDTFNAGHSQALQGALTRVVPGMTDIVWDELTTNSAGIGEIIDLDDIDGDEDNEDGEEMPSTSDVGEMALVKSPTKPTLSEDEKEIITAIKPIVTQELMGATSGEQIRELLESMTIVEKYSFITKGTIPDRFMRYGEESLAGLTSKMNTMFFRISDQVQSNLMKKVMERSKMRMGTKQAKLFQDDDPISIGRDLIRSLFYQFSSGGTETISEITSMATGVIKDTAVLQADANAAITAYTREMTELTRNTLQGLTIDLSIDLFMCKVSILLMLISVYITLATTFGNNRIIRYAVLPLIGLFMNDTRIALLFGGGHVLLNQMGIFDHIAGPQDQIVPRVGGKRRRRKHTKKQRVNKHKKTHKKGHKKSKHHKNKTNKTKVHKKKAKHSRKKSHKKSKR